MTPRARAIRSGPTLMILASLSFTVMVTAVKLARAEMSALELVFWRSALSAPVLLVVARPRRGFAIRDRWTFAARLVFGFAAMSCFYTATRGLALADLTLLTRLQPLLIVAVAPLVLGRSERSGGRVWLALGLGLAGTAVLLAPTLAVGSVHGLIAIVATVFSAGAHLCLRRLGETDSARAIVFWFQLGAASLAALASTLFGDGLSWPHGGLWPLLALAAAGSTVGQLLVTRAYALDRAGLVAAASYAGPVWAVLADLVVFGVVPRLPVVAGGALVVAGGWLLIRSPRPPHEREAAPATPGDAV